MKINVTFDVTEFGIISECPDCIFNKLSEHEYINLLWLVSDYFFELYNFSNMKEVKNYGKQRTSKKKQRQKDIQKSC